MVSTLRSSSSSEQEPVSYNPGQRPAKETGDWWRQQKHKNNCLKLNKLSERFKLLRDIHVYLYKYLFLHYRGTQRIHTLTLVVNLGTETGSPSGLCVLRSIMDWLRSVTGTCGPTLSSPEVLCSGWTFFRMSLGELVLSDWGILRMRGFCEERNFSISFLKYNESVLTEKGVTYSRRWCVFHFGARLFYAALIFQNGLRPWSLSSRRSGMYEYIVCWFCCFIINKSCCFLVI